MHLNDVQPVFEDGPYWKRGDFFLSVRNISTVMLFRPSTDEIVWWKQGPWAAQHDVDVIDDTTISVFNNDSYNFGQGLFVDGINEIDHFAFAADAVTRPLSAALERQSFGTVTQGSTAPKTV